MRKEEFLKELEYLLQDISDEDKEEALSYYRDYLEEAGPENEEKAIEDFGSPERVAAIIRADINGNLEDGGSFTDKGYEDERFKDPNFQVAKRLDLPDEAEESQKNYQEGPFEEKYQKEPFKEKYQRSRPVREDKPWTSKGLKVVLWIALIVVASPFLLGIGGTVLAVVAAVLAMAVGAALGLLALTVAAVILGVVLIVYGVIFSISAPMDGLLLCGLGIASMGCGLLGAVIMVAIAGLFIPLCFKGICKLVSWAGKRMGGKSHEKVH